MFILTEAPTQPTSESYIAVPESPVFVTENATEEIVWKIVDCDSDWQVRIVTAEYQLHPNLLPELVPIKMNADYNVMETCKNEHNIVNLSITFNENVLENLEYVECKVFRSSNDAIKYSSRVNFTTISGPLYMSSVFNSNPTTLTIPDSSSTTLIQAMPGSGCRLFLHFFAIGFSIANSALLWILVP